MTPPVPITGSAKKAADRVRAFAQDRLLQLPGQPDGEGVLALAGLRLAVVVRAAATCRKPGSGMPKPRCMLGRPVRLAEATVVP